MTQETKEDIYHKELDTLLRFGALINSSLNIERVLDSAMKWAEEFMNAEASSVYELNEEKDELFVRLARGEKKVPVKRFTLKVGEGVAGYVVQTGTPLVIQDVDKEKRFSDKFDKLTGFKTQRMICVPLIIRNKPIGALQVLNKKSGDLFNQNDLELLVSMSQQIAVAMDNAKLYQRLEKKFEFTSKELKVVQEKLIRTERLAAMGHLVQGVAHEIRNPVMTIGGFALRLGKALEQDTKARKYVEIIMEESDRLEKLVTEIRDFAEVQTATLSPEPIGPVLLEVLRRYEPLAEKQGINLSKDITDDALVVNMDPLQMISAISHIVENAIEAMPNGGALNIDVNRKNNDLLITVGDTGVGIPADQLEAVYDPFVTSKTRGAGLGLTMVHQIVKNHHGEIHITSEQGKGTVVVLRLPIQTDHPLEER